jgi:hypothetical protein
MGNVASALWLTRMVAIWIARLNHIAVRQSLQNAYELHTSQEHDKDKEKALLHKTTHRLY